MHRVSNKYHSGTNTVWRDWWLGTEGDGRKHLALHWKTEAYREKEGGRVERRKNRGLNLCGFSYSVPVKRSEGRHLLIKTLCWNSMQVIPTGVWHRRKCKSQHTQWLKSPGIWTYVSRGLGQIGYCTRMNNQGIIWEQQIANKMRKVWNKLVTESEQE